jgi:hypothetical protein
MRLLLDDLKSKYATVNKLNNMMGQLPVRVNSELPDLGSMFVSKTPASN